MLDYLERLRQKPENTRKKIAFFSSAGVTFAIFFLWLLSFYVQTGTGTGQIVEGQENVSPFGALKANVANIYEGWSSAKNAIKEVPFSRSFEVTADPNSVVKPKDQANSGDTNVFHWEE